MQAPIREHILTKNVIEKVYVTGQNEFMRVVGNGISFESLSGVEEEREKQVWIQNQQGSSGVACVSVDLCSNIIAYSSRSSEPNIYLHDSETKKLLGVLPGKDVLVEYQDICFSRNGNYLVAIGGVGDHRIYIWDVKKRERLVWSREIQVPGFCSFVSFDPLDDSLLCVGGSFGMHFIRIQKEVDKIYGEIVSVCLKKDQKSRALEIENSNMFQKEESCEDTYDFSNLEKLLDNTDEETHPRLDFVSHCWDKKRFVWVANTEGELLCISKDTGEMIRDVSCSEPEWNIVSLTPTLDYLVLCCGDGKIRWIDAEENEDVKTISLRDVISSSRTNKQESKDDDDDDDDDVIIPLSLAVDITYSFATVSCDDGSIVQIPLHCVENEDDDEEESEQEKTSPVDITSIVSVKTSGQNAAVVVPALAAPTVLSSSCVEFVVSLLPLAECKDDDELVAIVHQSSLNVWNCKTRELVHSESIDVGRFVSSQIGVNTCADVFAVSNLVAIGGSGGEVRFGTFSGDSGIWQNRSEILVHDDAICNVAFHPSNAWLITSSGTELAFVDCTKSEGPKVMSYCRFQNNRVARHVTWKCDDTALVYFEDGTMSVAADFSSSENISLTHKGSSGFSCDGGLVVDSCAPNTLLVADRDSKELVHYKGVNWRVISKDKLECAAAERLEKGHDVGISSLYVHRSKPFGQLGDERLVLTGSRTGEIAIWKIRADNEGDVCTSSSVHSGAVQRCVFSASAQFAVSVGADGTTVLWSCGNNNDTDNTYTYSKTSAYDNWKIEEAKERDVSSISKFQRSIHENLVEKTSKINEKNEKRLNELQDELDKMLKENETVPKLEKLNRDEFCLNTLRRDVIHRQNKQSADDLRRSLNFEIASLDLICERLRQDMIHSMRVVGCACKSFESIKTIRNFAIPNLSSEELRTRDLIRNLRRVAVQCTQETNKTLRSKVSDNVNYIVNAGQLTPSVEGTLRGVVETAGEKKKDEDEDEDEDEEDTKKSKGKVVECVGDFMYHPFELRTEKQKREQIVLLKISIDEIKDAFNLKFDDLMARKEAVFDTIVRDKNKRLKEIHSELEISSEPKYFVPKWDMSCEKPNSLLRVESQEIPFDKYISAAERERLKKEQEEDKKRRANRRRNSAPTRALQDMMNGTLHVAKNISALSLKIERQPWMDDLRPEEMNEEQRVEYDAYVKAVEELEESKEQYRKELRLEMKKIQSDVEDLTRAFDDRLSKLCVERDVARGRIREQEIVIAKIAHSMNVVHTAKRTSKSLSQRLNRAEHHRVKLAKRFAKVKVFHDTCLGDCTQKEKKLSEFKGSFKKQIQSRSDRNLDHDKLKILSSLYNTKAGPTNKSRRGSERRGSSSRRRSSVSGRMRSGSMYTRRSFTLNEDGVGTDGDRGPTTLDTQQDDNYRRRSSARKSGDMMKRVNSTTTKDSNINMIGKLPWKTNLDHDPYSGRVQMSKSEAISKHVSSTIQPLHEEYRPNDVTKDLFASMNELRFQRLQMEHDLSVARNESGKSKLPHKSISKSLDDIANHVKKLQSQSEKMTKILKKEQNNGFILIQLQQGRDEVYDSENILEPPNENSIFVSELVVKDLNREIAAKAKERITVLEKIKDYRKTINLMEWEHSYLLERTKDLEARYIDFHMLRVTKDMQDVIRDGSKNIDRNQLQIEECNRKLDHMEKMQVKLAKKMSREIDQITKRTLEMERENNTLQRKIKDLTTSVASKERVHTSYGNEESEKRRSIDRRMKMVVTRRKFIDLARAQTDEIEFLRHELTRLRQRSFPSFSQPPMPLNPDEDY